MSIHSAMLTGVATFASPDSLVHVDRSAYCRAFPLGELVTKQRCVGEAGEIAPATFEVSSAAFLEEFTRLITTQKSHPASSNNIAPSDQCWKN